MPNWWGAGKAAPVQVATCWGEPSSRPPQARSKATGGGIARWGAKPRPVWRNARPPGFNGPRLSVDVVLIDCASKQAKTQVEAGWSCAAGAGRDPRGTPPKDGGRWSLTRSEGAKAKAVKEGRSPDPACAGDGTSPEAPPECRPESAALRSRCRSNFPVSAPKPPPNRGQVLSTKTPRSRRFRLSKRRPFRDEKHHGMQQV